MRQEEILEQIRKATDAEPLGRRAACAAARLLERAPGEILEPLLEAGRELGLRGHGRTLTVSPNVFLPLTNLCRNRCSYCTFARTPDSREARTWSLLEVRGLSRRAREAGCREALFCLGDKPEIAYRSHRSWLRGRGFETTAEYLVEACRVSCEEGIFPHTNAGVLSAAEMAALRPLNASLGLMLETTSCRLRQQGGPHFHSPDKEPSLRLRMIREAGELQIPFTTGLLIGIGETPEERVDTLLAIRGLARAGGHIQEVIVQDFHPKPGTGMAACPSPPATTVAGTVALARLILGPAMNLQAPPNLSPAALPLLVRSGLNDWGGVSPLTPDCINPEMPWPELEALAQVSRRAGSVLRERLPAYPELIRGRPDLFDPGMLERLREVSDEEGYPRSSRLA